MTFIVPENHASVNPLFTLGSVLPRVRSMYDSRAERLVGAAPRVRPTLPGFWYFHGLGG